MSTVTDASQAKVGRSRGSMNESAASGARRGTESIGSLVRFALQVIRELPIAIRAYPAEIVRHAALIFRANSAVILFMMFTMGLLLNLTAGLLFSQVGIESYVAAIHTIGTMRGVGEVVFGWIFAAKVGCGIVAELGAMKISDEVDAMEVMGIRSVPYLAGTRLVAGLVVVPFIWVISLIVHWGAAYLISVPLRNYTSDAGFFGFLFLFQNLTDLIITLIWTTFMAAVIMIVSCYYGLTATGGPVGVGRNTAQSMLVNLVMISILAMALVQLFYGNTPNAPIGN